jgi:hypothetical protein
MRISSLILIVVTAGGAAAAAPLGKQINFSPEQKGGVCMVTFPGAILPGSDKPYEFRFSYRVRDGNFGGAIIANGWDKASANADSEQNRPMTLVFDTGKTTTSRSGGYSSGFEDEGWAGWGAGAGSEAAMAMLAEASSVRIRFDDQDFGPIDLQMKRLAYISLTDCAKRVRGEPR